MSSELKPAPDVDGGKATEESALAMYRAVVGIGLLCSLMIVLAYELTKPAIAKNRAELLGEAIFRVLPGAVSSTPFTLSEDGGFRESPPVEADLHAGYDADGALLGLAIRARGMGYQDTITALYGYDPAAERIVGFAVLESRETPGLGDRIGKDLAFLKSVSELSVALDDDGSGVAHAIEAVKSGASVEPWQLDGITGATISSEAVARLLRESTAHWLPVVARRKKDFEP